MSKLPPLCGHDEPSWCTDACLEALNALRRAAGYPEYPKPDFPPQASNLPDRVASDDWKAQWEAMRADRDRWMADYHDLRARFDALAKDAEAMRQERDKARDLALESAAQIAFGLMETGLDEQGRFFARSLSDEIRALKSGTVGVSRKPIRPADISKNGDSFDTSRESVLRLAADALEWYANPLTWPDENAVEYACAAIADSGSRAREALRAINAARAAAAVKTDTFPNS